MRIELKEIAVRELVDGYRDNREGGVVGYGGRLDIRPPYQREFIYKDKQRDAVISTVMKNFPLNVMYWAVRDDGGYEVIDGQQRTISVCQFVADMFMMSIGNRQLSFENLQADQREQILDYKLMIYFCEGTDSEKLEWFKTINIAGERLTEQELRNAIYHGQWLTDAKRYFSKTGCGASQIGTPYLNGSAIRQEYLETAISWISGGKIEEYMSAHQHDPDSSALWRYFRDVIEWVQASFPTYRREMKGVEWGALYNCYKDKVFNVAELENRVAALMLDDDVTNKRGIYPYVLTGDERSLSVRAFSEKQKREMYERQAGVCARCGKNFDISAMEADHITPWSQGGHTDTANGQMLCRDCNRRKSNK